MIRSLIFLMLVIPLNHVFAIFVGEKKSCIVDSECVEDQKCGLESAGHTAEQMCCVNGYISIITRFAKSPTKLPTWWNVYCTETVQNGDFCWCDHMCKSNQCEGYSLGISVLRGKCTTGSAVKVL
jgi:hypothetical protein